MDKSLSNKNRCPGISTRGDKNRSSEKRRNLSVKLKFLQAGDP